MNFIEQFNGFVDRGRNVLDVLSDDADNPVPERRYKGNDIEKRVGMTLAHIYIAEENGKLPVIMQRDQRMRRIGYTLNEINILQDHFGNSPRRKYGDDPVVLSFMNQKGGSWKTTTSNYAASYYASLGFRVLLIDLDAQASTTINFGYSANIDVNQDNTIVSFLEKDRPNEEITSIILDTHICNLKLIPACSALSDVEYSLTLEMGKVSTVVDDRIRQERQKDIFTRLKQSIKHAAKDFDIVILDGTPSTGLLPVNITIAADFIVMPVPTERLDFAATISFSEILLNEASTILERTDFDVDKLYPAPIIIPTRFSSGKGNTRTSEKVLDAIRYTFKDACVDGYIKKHDSVVSNLSLVCRTIFCVNAGKIASKFGDIDVKSPARKNAVNNFSEIFDQILEEKIKPKWPSFRREIENVKSINLSEVN